MQGCCGGTEGGGVVDDYFGNKKKFIKHDNHHLKLYWVWQRLVCPPAACKTGSQY